MIFRNSLNYISQFFFFFTNKTRNIYLNSSIYNNKISKIEDKNLEYKPSPSLLDCLIKYEKKKIKIEDFSLNSIWSNNNMNNKDYKKLHSFFWLFSLDLKSSKKSTQSTIENWIESNQKYNFKNWDTDILPKRIIAWISNSKLTYEDSNEDYKKKFNATVQKQVNHLINEIERSEWIDDKMIGCSAIILTGLAYKNNSRYLSFGINLLKKIIKFSFDDNGFPKSRNIRQLTFYLKYFVLIREWLKESQTDIPEYINETIYYLGQSYALICQDLNQNILFNGNHVAYNGDFENYLRRLGYKFKNETNEVGGYVILKNKKIALVMDVGEPPEKKFSTNYQSGALSFEIIIGNKKLISNSGYFQNYKHQLNNLSKSTAAQSTMIIDNNSSCNFKKESNQKSMIEQGLKIIKKSIIFEKNYWSIKSAHDGYNKKYGVIHERQIEFFTENNKFIGNDKLIKKRNFKNSNFEIRFHLEPDAKVMKTQDEKSIFIELDKEAWKFVCEDHSVNIETGLYFGKKNSYTENKNIFISGMTQSENQTIKWELIKIT
ncbi:heparinase II/III-family protein [Candidatus Pelagibacter sp.]|nr:heparinase II/III-family protein [Candidatus Pelagibacter sp.]